MLSSLAEAPSNDAISCDAAVAIVCHSWGKVVLPYSIGLLSDALSIAVIQSVAADIQAGSDVPAWKCVVLGLRAAKLVHMYFMIMEDSFTFPVFSEYYEVF